MSKKTKRQVRKVPSQAAVVSEVSNAVVNKQPSFNPDYSYVSKDLRRIAILASSFVLILVVLSFFLR
jgi:hypothetical protein